MPPSKNARRIIATDKWQVWRMLIHTNFISLHAIVLAVDVSTSHLLPKRTKILPVAPFPPSACCNLTRGVVGPFYSICRRSVEYRHIHWFGWIGFLLLTLTPSFIATSERDMLHWMGDLSLVDDVVPCVLLFSVGCLCVYRCTFDVGIDDASLLFSLCTCMVIFGWFERVGLPCRFRFVPFRRVVWIDVGSSLRWMDGWMDG